MKAILEFDLEDPSERLSHRRCINATGAYIAIHEFDNILREYIKHNHDIQPGSKWALPDGYHFLTDKESELVEHIIRHIRHQYHDVLKNSKIDLEDLE